MVYFRSHRKAVLVLVVLVLVGGVAAWRLGIKRHGASIRGNFAIADPVARQEQLKKLQRDSDNDGLRDWEEMLYRADPQKPDTDGDGTPDGEEVRAGRDPAQLNTSKNPAEANDFMATSTPAQDTEQSGQLQNLTKQLAAQIGKEIIARRIANPSVPFDAETSGQGLVDNFMSSLPDDSAPSFTHKDIVIGTQDTNAAIKAYKQGSEHIIKTAFAKFTKDELVILQEALEAQDYSKLNQLDAYIPAYDRTIEQLKKLSVPPALAALHLEYLNLAIREEDAVKKMRGAAHDPVGAGVGAKEYLAIRQRFDSLLARLGNEYKKNGIAK